MHFHLEPTPLDREVELHRAHLFDRHMVRFLTLMNNEVLACDSIAKDVNRINLEDLVCDQSIIWPEC